VKDLLKSPKRKPSGNASEMRDIKCYNKILIISLVPLRGILTNRDIKSSKSLNDLVKNIMTPFEKMIVHQGPELPTKDKVFELMLNNKIEKMPVVEKNFIVCLIHLKDIEVGSRNTKPVKDVMG
jgi:signal-transduction protein with cAMP-binding, CBS, and nucleotidyltransferase domain